MGGWARTYMIDGETPIDMVEVCGWEGRRELGMVSPSFLEMIRPYEERALSFLLGREDEGRNLTEIDAVLCLS